jgi:Ca2+-binding RTX toxin-like protein
LIVENAGEGTDTVTAAFNYTLSANLENLTLSGSAVAGTGSADNNVITGNALNNVLDGAAGVDTLRGMGGDDTYVVDDAGDVVDETSGGFDAGGIDTVRAGASYTLGNFLESLVLTGNSSATGTGNTLDNVLDGSQNAGANVLAGGLGNDTYILGAGDTIAENPGEGTDSVQSDSSFVLAEGIENLVLTGAAAINGTGNTLNNTLTGNTAANILDGGAGTDTMNGGAGDDTYVIGSTGEVVNENASEGIDTVLSSVTYTLGLNVENLTLTGTTAINGTGNTLANVLRGNSVANVLTGGTGNDSYYVSTGDTVTEGSSAGTDTVFADVTWTLASNLEELTLIGTGNINGTGNTLANVLRGNTGINTLTGGTGDDSYYVGAGDTVTEASSAGTDTVFADLNWTLGINVERLTLLGTGNINATGNTLANLLTGNAGNNTLDGGTGADTMAGGAGDDLYVRDNTGDVITENANEGIDTVQSSVAYTLALNVENLTLTSTGNIAGTGNALNNVLTGNSGTNSLTGGAGNDTYFIGTGDTVVESAGGGEDLVNSSVLHTLASNVENLILTGTTAINGTGNTLNNLVRGNSVVNTLAGAAGNDVLEGGDGNDTLGDTGGTNLFNGQGGADTLNGNTGNELLIGGAGNDTVNTGAGADIIAFNRGDGADTVAVSTVKDNSLSLGGGIAYADLFFQKSGNNLILKTAGSAGTEQVTFTNWYAATANHSVLNLQMVVEASADFDAGSPDALRNKKVAEFNFDGLVNAFDAARAADPLLTNWALTNALVSFHLSGSDTVALGGDLAYQHGRFGNLANVGTVGAQNVMGSAQFGSATQTFQSLSSLQEGITRLS